MGQKKKDDKVYRYVILSGSAVIRILLLVLAVVILIAASRTAYQTGYSLFAKSGEDEASGARTELFELIHKLTARGNGDDH